MRFTGISLALALGVTIFGGTAAQAASRPAYEAERQKHSIVKPISTEQLFAQLSAMPGQVVELTGTVNGLFSDGETRGYLLRLPDEQTVVVTTKADDPDVDVGNAVTVLARVPAAGAILEGMTAMRADGAAQGMAPQTPRDLTAEQAFVEGLMPVEFRPPQVFTKAPTQINDGGLTYSTDVPLAKQEYVIGLYADRIRQVNDNIDPELAQKIAFHILDKSERHGVDPRLVFALVAQESRFNPRAVSYAGAQGLGQLMPGTAAGLGVRNAFDVEDNLEGAIRYLSGQLNEFGKLSLALAAYNAGPGNVKRYGGVPPFRETQNYVRKIWDHYCKLSGLDPKTGQYIASAR